MVTFLRSFFLLSALLFSLPLVAGNVKLRGTVTAKGEGAVPYATIGVQGSPLGTYASADGCYELELPEGRYLLVVTAVGFETFQKEIVVGKTNRETDGEFDREKLGTDGFQLRHILDFKLTIKEITRIPNIRIRISFIEKCLPL